MAFMPPLLRIAVWATLTAVFSMFLYKIISPQKKLAGIKEQQKAARAQLMAYDGEFEGLLGLIMKDLGLAMKIIGVALGPVLLSIVPVLAIMFCLYVIYGYRLPEPGAPTLIQIQPEEAQPVWSGQPQLEPTELGWILHWPKADAPVTITDTHGQLVVSLPPPAAIPEISKPSWLTALFPNPAGEITESSAIDAVLMDMPTPHYTAFGPDWMRGFAFWYFSILLAISLFIKFRFRII